MERISGRQTEKAILERVLLSKEPEFVAVYGRRRVGKTFLIREFFQEELVFDMSGTHQGGLKEQLANFSYAISDAQGEKTEIPKNWQEAFFTLIDFLKTRLDAEPQKKHVIFFDELPWLASPRSRFMAALEHFWNSWASKYNNIIMVVCGSAAAWMIQTLLHNRGGLHNRATRRIRMDPFTLGETEQFLNSRGIVLDRRQITELYMAMGGVPHYLKEVEHGLSAAENIENICFRRSGLLYDEYQKLFTSLFNDAEKHHELIDVLAKKRQGMTRKGIEEASKGLNTGGGLTQVLRELEESGFISASQPYGKTKRDSLYRLTDEFTLFNRYWMTKGKSQNWQSIQKSPAWNAWSGYAFETICMKHIDQIKSALSIAGISSQEYSWIQHGTDDRAGAQIDLLIDRADGCINVCEIKFSHGHFTITKAYANKLRERSKLFAEATKHRKTLFLTMVTPKGLAENIHSTYLFPIDIQAENVLFDQPTISLL